MIPRCQGCVNVLNLTIAMLRAWMFFLLIFSLAAVAAPVSAQTATPPPVLPSPTPAAVFLRAPAAGQALQGRVEILGGSAAAGFQSYQMLFSYTPNPTGAWFLLASSETAVQDGALAVWDTTTITDGVYTLRLVIQVQDGREMSAQVEGLRVRNYTPIETNTPSPIPPSSTPQPGETPLPTQTPTPTETPLPPTATTLPPNPAEISQSDLYLSLAKGALGVTGLFALAGVYLLTKKLRRTPRRFMGDN